MLTDHAAGAGRLAAALVLSALLPVAGLAQTPAPAADTGASAAAAPSSDAPAQGGMEAAGAAADPHRLLDDLSGGPQGSPTAQRGNPQPGTSTSIPTTHPATGRPLEQRGAGNENVTVEDTGIEGQCDPVVTFGCPAIADQLPQADAAGGAAADTAAQPTAGGAAEPIGAAN